MVAWWRVSAFREYFKAQGLFGMPESGEIVYSQLLELDLAEVVPSVAGPRRPQDRIALTDVKEKFGELLLGETKGGGYGKTLAEANKRFVILTGINEAKALDLTLTGGGDQDSDSGPQDSPCTASRGLESDRTTRQRSTEIEMMQNRPDARSSRVRALVARV